MTTLPFAPRSDLDLPAAFGLVAAARHFGPHVVHLHDARAHATGWLAAHAVHAPCVVSRRVAFAAAGRAPHAWKYRRLAADAWHAISPAVKDELVGLGLPAERIVVVPDAVDFVATSGRVRAARTDGSGAALRRTWGADGSGPLFGVIAALTAEKGHRVLLEAFARLRTHLPGARLVVVGDGPERARLEEQARALGIAPHVTWAGRADDLAPVLAALDGLVLPSLAEGFGSVLLLARAARVPIVASDVGGVPEALDGGEAGRLVPPGDAALLADALAGVVDDSAGTSARVERAHVAGRRFDVSAQAQQFEALYRQIAPTSSGERV